MSMQHKAYVFDYVSFERELLPVLEQALGSGSSEGLKVFIERHRKSIVDPYEGEPLESGWEEFFEVNDPHRYGDFALAKYYDPCDDVGLCYEWQACEEAIERLGGPAIAVYGTTIGPRENLFDPGKYGSWVQSPTEVAARLGWLLDHDTSAEEEAVRLVVKMLHEAKEAKKGLYVTF